MQNIAIKSLKIFVILQLLVLSSSCLDYSRNMVVGVNPYDVEGTCYKYI